MMACSDSDEQFYLNSCESAACNQGFIYHASCIVPLIALAQKISSHIKDYRLIWLSKKEPAYPSLWPNTSPSIYSYVFNRLTIFDKQIHDLELKAHNLADRSLRKENITYKELFQLASDWNYAVQGASSMFTPNSPVVLTKKIFTQEWSMSAHCMSLACLFGSFIPGEPFIWCRKKGPRAQYLETISWISYRIYIGHRFKDRVLSTYAQIFQRQDDKGKTEMLDFLWLRTLDNGGFMFQSKEVLYFHWVNHLCFLIAITDINKNKLFIVSDPEITGYKLLNYADMTELILNPKLCFELDLN